MLRLAVVLLALGPASAHAAAPVSWGAPQPVASVNAFGGLACPSATFCVASDDQGRILTSSTPADGASWTVTTPDAGNPLGGLSCAPDASVCAVTDGTNIYTSADPGGSSPTWTGQKVDDNGLIAATSCPTTSFCVAVGGDSIYTSSAPTSTTNPAWTLQNTISGVHGSFDSISCPTAQLCVWVSYLGDIFTSSDGGVHHTKATPTQGPFGPPFGLEAVSCASVSLCVVMTQGGQDLVSTDPTGTASHWSIRTAEQQQNGEGIPVSVSCPSHLCAAVDGNGYAYADANVLGPAPLWSADDIDQTGEFGSGPTVSCPPATYVCYAADNAGQVFQGQVAKETLTVRRSGDGSGTVTGPQIHCPTTCSAGYPAGTVVSLKAHPSKGSVFKSWSGACSGKGACTVTMAGAEQAVATFVIPAPHGTKITHADIHGKTATFSFSALGKVAGFKCALQKGSGKVRFSKCSSPKSYRQLAAGKYRFLVKAYNATGSDPHPASKSFTIK